LKSTLPTAVRSRADLLKHFDDIRATTENLCKPLAVEDFVVQPIEDVSPPKWHLGHTTWFFEQVVLEQFAAPYRPYHDGYYFVFNSYYESFGDRVERALRGTLSRPTVDEVYAYRHAVNERMRDAIENVPENKLSEFAGLVTLGLNHEQQHQELLITDIKYIFASNPLLPVYTDTEPPIGRVPAEPMRWLSFEGGLEEFGADGSSFAYDNESPRHKAFVHPFQLADRPVTCGEYLEFMNDSGYERAELWLSNGWDTVQETGWRAPLFWVSSGEDWQIISLSGLSDIEPSEPVCHVSHYEAAAYARWAGRRLPLETEWELAAVQQQAEPPTGNLLESGFYHPLPVGVAQDEPPLKQMIGDVWEWTASAYLPYPGYKQALSALGEYNGKFMNDQMVLRGGSCATPASHIRPTYRNFFQSDKRWQFAGFRMADDA
jgi:ergothioneine biosynthesis protein EgtB